MGVFLKSHIFALGASAFYKRSLFFFIRVKILFYWKISNIHLQKLTSYRPIPQRNSATILTHNVIILPVNSRFIGFRVSLIVDLEAPTKESNLNLYSSKLTLHNKSRYFYGMQLFSTLNIGLPQKRVFHPIFSSLKTYLKVFQILLLGILREN